VMINHRIQRGSKFQDGDVAVEWRNMSD
jgi:hypothetical protein